MNLRVLGYLDTIVILSNLRLRHWEHLEGDGDIRTLVLRDEDGDMPILAKWASARSFLQRLRNEAAPFLNGLPAELGRAWIESLLPGRSTPWRSEDQSDWLTLRVCLATPPGGWLYCNGEAMVLQPGIVAYVNVQAPTSSLNLGPSPRLHLCCEVRRPDL